MAYNIFHSYGLDKIHDSFTESVDYKDTNPDQWDVVQRKSVMDSDGFMTDYVWYTNGDKHIFMFGDEDITEPDEDYADWECETESEAQQWFDNYQGFEDSDINWEDDSESYDVTPRGNANFMNDGFNRIYSDGLELED